MYLKVSLKSLDFIIEDIVFKSEDLNKDLKLRVGGLVKEDTHIMNGIENEFVITDNKNEVKVIYSGVLPDLFAEGRGVIVKGRFNGKLFAAVEVLAKHDEKYMPRELQQTLDKSLNYKAIVVN